MGEVWPMCDWAPTNVCLLGSHVAPAIETSPPSPLCRMCSCSASEGAGRRREDQLCWCSVYLDSWHFSPCLHFKAIHHAQGITSRPWIAELAPWDVFSCENWLGRTALPYEKNALTFLFLKGGVNRRGCRVAGLFGGYVLPLCPRWWPLDGERYLVSCWTSVSQWSVCVHGRMDQWKRNESSEVRAVHFGAEALLQWGTMVLLDEKFGLGWYWTQWSS